MPPKRRSAEEHLAKYLLKMDSGCWLWNRPNRRDKLMWNGERSVHARKVAYWIRFQSHVEPPMYLKPTCGNVDCIHPEHQEIVPKRYLARTRVTDEAILEIKQKVENKGSYRKVAKEFGVSYQTVYNVVHGVIKVTVKVPQGEG